MDIDNNKTLLFGIHTTLSALKNKNRRCYKLFITKKNKHLFLEEIKKRKNLIVNQVTNEKLNSLLKKNTIHQGCALEVDSLKIINLEHFLETKKTPPYILIVMDQITDIRNAGAIIRSAAAFCAKAILIPEKHTVSIKDNLLSKTASGALELVTLVKIKNLTHALNILKKHNFWCVGLDENAHTTIKQIKTTEYIAIILGSEGSGLRRLTKESCDILAKIPTNPNFPSLNVSNAASIALYEFLGRR